MTEPPRFVGQAAVARELGVGRAAVSNWLRRYPGATPEPAAYLNDGIPLWSADQMEMWREFKRRRDMSYRELIEAVEQERDFTELVQLGQDIERGGAQ